MPAAPITFGQPCAGCHRPMVPNSRPARATRPAGMVSHSGHGRCATCSTNRVRSSGTYTGGRPRKDLDVDDVAVDRAAQGERLQLNRLERIAAVELLKKRRYTHREIARRIGLCERVVQRYVTLLATTGPTSQEAS